MRFIVRGIVYGFAFSLGAAVFKKVADKIGLGEQQRTEPSVGAREGAGDPGMQHRFS